MGVAWIFVAWGDGDSTLGSEDGEEGQEGGGACREVEGGEIFLYVDRGQLEAPT